MTEPVPDTKHLDQFVNETNRGRAVQRSCQRGGQGLRSRAAALVTILFMAAAAAPAQVSPPASQGEVDQLREEVKQLRAAMEQLRALLDARTKPSEAAPIPSPQAALPTEPTLPGAPGGGGISTRAEIRGTPQTTGLPEEKGLAMATKANGGDLSGAGNLLRTDRVAIGGYGDFQFREASLQERNDGGGTPTFQSTRFVLGIAAVLSQRQNIVFNSEIEYEFGSREVDVEQAFVDWKVRPEFSFRAGIYPPSLGHFNTYHDSNLNLTTLRPLINQFILNTAYRDAGIGVRGRFNLPGNMKLSYEANILNGMQALDADGNPTPFSRLLGQSSASEPGLIAFQATNGHKAVTGRIGFSPILGLDVGTSIYNGRINLLGEPPRSVTMLFYDASYRRGPWAFDAEYARTNIVGGIPRQSPALPVFDPSYPDTVAALAKYVAGTTPGQDGFYVEGAYNFHPGFMRRSFDEGAYIAPVIRFEGIRRDRTLPDFYLNERRTVFGVNIAPSPSVIFKLNYLFNHPLGRVPDIAGPFGGADFGNNPIPFLGYGRNGFTGSVAYVF